MQQVLYTLCTSGTYYIEHVLTLCKKYLLYAASTYVSNQVERLPPRATQVERFPPGWEGFQPGEKVSTQVERFPPGWEGFHPGGKVSTLVERFPSRWKPMLDTNW